MGSHSTGDRVWTLLGGGAASTAGQIPRQTGGPSHTLTGKGTAAWVAGTDSVRVSVAEAAALQSFPPGWVWHGSQTEQYQQIGNAVPPLLGRALGRVVLTPGASA
jgi:site-specific DNA-cytosine methylase